MKNSFAILALAATLGEVSATFKGAKPFTCPDNVDNDCFDRQKGGFDWKDLTPGKFDKYHDFDFKGWTCEDKKSKYNDKAIKGECGPDKDGSPSFGFGDKFSVGFFDVSVEFDCDLEFHYDMPDGKICKERSRCSKDGTTVKNTQCGGAKNVTVVYPDQPDKPKKKCGIDLWKIGFDCDKKKPPKPPKHTPPPPPPSTLSPIVSTSEAPKSSEPVKPPKESSKPVEPSQPPKESSKESSIPAESTPAESTTPVESSPVETPDVPEESSPVETPDIPKESTPVPEESKPAESSVVVPPPSSAPAPESTTSAAIPQSSNPAKESSVSEPPVETTSYVTTSTIFTTTVSTITDCGPEKPECGDEETPVVTLTIPVTTTVCDVTETITRSPTPSEKPDEKPEDKPEEPIESLPCPEVVPKCLNTWLFDVGCDDNTDTKCYCPDVEFVKNIFTCIYAHGETDEIISEATKFFQGICAEHAPENPAVVTGAETVTKVLTVVPTAVPSDGVKYTTVTLDATVVVPCVSDGTTIEGSSTTEIIKTTIEVPEVGFSTGVSDAVPVAPTPEPVTPETPEEGKPDGEVPSLVEPPVSNPVVGTGGAVPSSTGDVPVEAGAGKLATAGIGAVAALMVAMAAF